MTCWRYKKWIEKFIVKINTWSLYEGTMIELELHAIRVQANDAQELAVFQYNETKDIMVTH